MTITSSISIEWNIQSMLLVYRKLYPCTEKVMKDQIQAIWREKHPDVAPPTQENIHHLQRSTVKALHPVWRCFVGCEKWWISPSSLKKALSAFWSWVCIHVWTQAKDIKEVLRLPFPVIASTGRGCAQACPLTVATPGVRGGILVMPWATWALCFLQALCGFCFYTWGAEDHGICQMNSQLMIGLSSIITVVKLLASAPHKFLLRAVKNVKCSSMPKFFQSLHCNELMERLASSFIVIECTF